MRPSGFRCLLVLGLAVVAGAPVTMARPEKPPSNDKINKKIDNFTLKGADGKPISLYDLKDKKAVVVVFLSFDCPVSNSYAPALAELAKANESRGVSFLAVNSTDEEGAGHFAKKAAEYKIPFPVLKDDGHAAADSFKADATPEAFVVDHNFVLRYRGRIDNSYYARLRKNNQTTRADLKLALDELLAGKPVSEPVTKAVGCPIPRVREVKRTGSVTYYRDVLPILQENCQQCHRPGEVGPFSLMTYRQAVGWATDIKEYTQDRKMPPWKPVEGPAFHNERRLSDKQIATLAAWVDGGTPEGDPGDAPPPRQFTDGWHLGQPDLVLTVPEEMTIGPAGTDLFRVFVLPTNEPEDRYVTAFEVRPGNKRIVHHTLNYIDTTGQARKLEQKEKERDKEEDEQDHGPGYSMAMGVGFLPQGGLGGWAPGQLGRRLPEGTAHFLPKGADVVVQVHYHRDGRVEKDRTAIGLYFAKKPVARRMQGLVIPGRFIYIPAGEAHYRVKGAIEVERDCTLYSVMPHMHMLGREIKVTLTPPEGAPFTLVAINDWNYNWQETYLLKEPIEVKAGTKFSVEAFYDNTDKNPSNPFNPPRRVFFGEQTDNEMCFVFLGATSDKPGRIPFKREGLRLLEPSRPAEDKPVEKKP
jgi:peroxiredoxin